MRVAIAGLLHESNTFNANGTNLGDFQIHRGEHLISAWRGTHHEMGGFIEGASRFGYEAIPILMAQATPSGKVTADAFEMLTRELVERLEGGSSFDGLLLALHGAMVAENYHDGDGEIIRRVREALGGDMPIVVTHDFHANISAQAVRDSTALIVYKTNPHLDQHERGLQAAHIISRIIAGDIHPVQALRKPPLLLNIVHQNTSREPMRGIMRAARDLEQELRVVVASVAGGYQYADVYEMGPSVVVVTDGDMELAEREAECLSQRLWDTREQLGFMLPESTEAVRQATMSENGPVILVDMGDNIGGGSAGDSTCLLAELMRQNAQGWLVVLADPEAVQVCARAGIGQVVSMPVGGKHDDLHGRPLEITGRVKCLHDGLYIEPEPRHGGSRNHDQGTTALLEVDDDLTDVPNLLLLTTRREPPFSLQQLLSVGIQPQQQKILVVKAAIAYRAAYEPIAGRIIEVDTPGLTSVNPSRYTYHSVRRPIWGLDYGHI